MTLKQIWDRDTKALSQLSTPEKLAFIWEYYKLPILAVLFAGLLAAMTLSSVSQNSNIVLKAVFVNAASAEGDSALLDDLLVQSGAAAKGGHISINANLNVGQETNDMLDVQSVQLLGVLFTAAEVDLFAADESTFARYAAEDAFLDLTELLDARTLQAHEADLVYFDTSEGGRVAAGILIGQDSPLHRAGYYRSGIIAGIAARGTNRDTALSLLKALL